MHGFDRRRPEHEGTCRRDSITLRSLERLSDPPGTADEPRSVIQAAAAMNHSGHWKGGLTGLDPGSRRGYARADRSPSQGAVGARMAPRAREERAKPAAVPVSPVEPVVIEKPILNTPFREPAQHFKFSDQGITNEIVQSRRSSAYFVPIATSK